jgi:glycolate oxidase FAD binding subunit
MSLKKSWEMIEATYQQLLGKEQVESPQPWLEKLQDRQSNLISCAIYPETPEQLAASVKIAQLNNWSLIPCGQGTKLNWGGLINARSPIILVSSQRLNRLVEHAAGDLTVTVEAGMNYGELQKILAQSGQFLAIDPPFADLATIGGVIATASSGSWRQRYLSVRDMCLGFSLVRADGEQVKGGGRVVKNVAGYDLMKLLTGSYGSLAIITQATFRLYPLPQVTETLVFSGTMAAIANLSAKILQSQLIPSKLDLIAGKILESFEINSEAALIVDFASSAASVEIQVDRAIALSHNLGLNVAKVNSDIWQKISDRIWQPGQAIAKVGILSTEIAAILPQIQKITPISAQFHFGVGLGWLIFDASISATEFLQVRQLISESGGFLSLLKAPIELKTEIADLWNYGKDTLLLMRQLKQKFDSNSILSPGRVL